VDCDLARRQAVEAERLSGSSPHRARGIAQQARKLARSNDDQLTIVIAERALGLAARELNNLTAARRHLRRSIKIAEVAGLTREAATTKGRLAYVVSLGGDTESALVRLDTPMSEITGVTRAQLRVQRALVLQRAGRIEEALEQYRLAIPPLQRGGEYLDEARARSNRAVLQTYRGNYSAAESDLRRAEALAPLAGEGVSLAKIHHNLGYVAACRGDVPEALTWFDQAQAEFAALGRSEATALADRCEVLLSVGLAAEGLDTALRAVTEFEQRGSALDLAEARLMAARAALLAGDPVTAARSARQARTEFRRQKRVGWEALAEYVIARSRLSQRPRSAISGLTDIADKLTEAGWLLPALELRLVWSTAALAHGYSSLAVEQLQVVSSCRGKRPALIRGHAWHAEALLRQLGGDVPGCRSALRAGLRALDQFHATLGATDLQAHAASQAEELAVLGCRLALDEGSAVGVLEWAERWRAGTLRRRPVRPPHGREIERLLAELRRLCVEMEAAALEGRATAKFLHQQAALEAAIRDKTRHAPGSRVSRLIAPPSVRELRHALGEKTLVEFISIDGRLYAVTVTPQRTRLFELGTVAEVLSEADSLRFSYARLARRHGSMNTIETFTAAAEHAAQRIDTLLFGALQTELDDGPIVIVPTGRLHHLPWAGIRTCADRTVSVAPSAAVWVDTTRRQGPKSSGRVVLVAGPGVPHAEDEIAKLHVIYPDATVLVGADATTVRVAKALDGARIAHIAAHGIFRSDNPLFSSLQLFDGRLTVYDLELIRKAPELLVLSACESGLNAVHPGDELLGFSAAVLSLGTKNLMASVVPVPDLTTASFMVNVHHRLARKERPPDALAHARNDVCALHQAELLTTAGFVCFGA
jgi:tetratricopeptide (TPR) repeat protein